MIKERMKHGILVFCKMKCKIAKTLFEGILSSSLNFGYSFPNQTHFLIGCVPGKDQNEKYHIFVYVWFTGIKIFFSFPFFPNVKWQKSTRLFCVLM